jgi:hypothetical protein
MPRARRSKTSVSKSKLRMWKRAHAGRLRKAALFVAFSAALIGNCGLPDAMAQEISADEYQLKAAILYNLAQYIDWPASAYASPESPIVYCILGRDPFGAYLRDISAKQSVRGHPFEIRHVRNDKAIRDCHLLYISSSERKSIAGVLANLNAASVLTVADMSQFAAHGGMIEFSLEEKRVRFDVNLEAATQTNVKISARLLALAKIVSAPGGAGANQTASGSAKF